MRFFTADQAKRQFGALLKAADEEFVEISKHGRPAYMLMPIRFYALFEKFHQAHEELRALRAAENAIDDFLAGNAEAGTRGLAQADALIRAVIDPPRGKTVRFENED